MATNVMITGVGGAPWEATLPDGVTLSQAGVPTGTYFLDGGITTTSPLVFNFNYDLAARFTGTLGEIRVPFRDLPGGETANINDTANGLRGAVAFNFTNDLDIPLQSSDGTVVFYLSDGQTDAENNPVHPLYVHFHNVASSYGDFVARSQTIGSPGTNNAPSYITLYGELSADEQLSIGPFTMHQRDVAGVDDSFYLGAYPSRLAFTPADLAKITAQWEALNNPNTPVTPDPVTPDPGTPTSGGDVDWNALGARVLEYYNQTGSWGLLSEWLSPNPPDHGGGGTPTFEVDWDVLSRRITDYFLSSGEYGLLDDWLSPPPPDGGSSDYLIA